LAEQFKDFSLLEERAGGPDHMAFSVRDRPATVATLKRKGIGYGLRRLPGAFGSCSSMT
jgi:hypothetical protein